MLSNKPEFFNREHEFNEFSILFEAEESTNTAVLLSAPSGRGKSAFTNKFGNTRWSGISLRIDLPVEKVAEDTGSLLILQIASHFNDLASKKKGSQMKTLEQFSKESFSLETDLIASKKLAILVGNQISPFLGTISVGVVEAVKENFSGKRIKIEEMYPREKMICQNYCFYCLSQHKTLLTISNIQACDIKTLEFISNCGSLKKLGLILEYTQYEEVADSNKYLDESLVLRYLENSYDQVIKYHLKPLEWSHIKRILEYRGQETEELAEKFYEGKNYNIREIIDYSKLGNSSRDKITRIANTNRPSASTALLFELKFEAQLLTAIIVAHSSSIEMEFLVEMLKFQDKYIFSQIDELMKTLQKIDVLSIKSSGGAHLIEISHDHISERFIKDEKLFKSTVIACKYWWDFYERLLNENEFYDLDKITIISRITGIVAVGGFSDYLPRLLNELEHYSSKAHFPKKTIRHLVDISNKILSVSSPRGKEADEILSKIIDILYKSSWLVETLEVLEKHTSRSPSQEICLAVILHRLGRYTESNELVFSLLERLSERSAKHDRALVLLRIIEAINYRGLHDYKRGQSVYKKLLNNNSYYKIEEYGVVLRQSAIFLKYSESIPYIENAVRLFENSGNQLEETYCRLTLAMQYTRLGRLDDALAELSFCEEALPKISADREVIWNNRAVISMLRGELSMEAKSLLQQASTVTRDQYRYLTGTSNLYVFEWFLEKNHYSESKSNLLSYINNNELSDKYLPLLSYYNFMIAASVSNDWNEANRFKRKIDELDIYPTPLWETFLSGSSVYDTDMSFMKKNVWMIGFFPIYHFSVPNLNSAFY